MTVFEKGLCCNQKQEDLLMEKYIQKPQMKDEEHFMKEDYPKKIRQSYRKICEGLDEIQISDLELLADQIYKSAYLDGFEDALYFKDI